MTIGVPTFFNDASLFQWKLRQFHSLVYQLFGTPIGENFYYRFQINVVVWKWYLWSLTSMYKPINLQTKVYFMINNCLRRIRLNLYLGQCVPQPRNGQQNLWYMDILFSICILSLRKKIHVFNELIKSDKWEKYFSNSFLFQYTFLFQWTYPPNACNGRGSSYTLMLIKDIIK